MSATDLSLLMEAADGAAEIALSFWKSEMRIERKKGGSPVSEADYAVDEFLRERLSLARPQYGWLSEETEDDLSRLSRESVFVVDPIDGTRAYIDGHPTWAISLAVVRNGQPTSAVVYLPARNKLYTAEFGKGAELNGHRLAATVRDSPEGARVLAPKSSLDPRRWARKPPQFKRQWRPSLAYRFCLVAEARFDALLTLGDAWEWDIAAGMLIAQEARAVVTDRNGNTPCLNNASAKVAGIFAAPPALHRVLISCHNH